MEQVKYETAAGKGANRYASPMVKVVFVKAQGILCVSNPEEYTTEMNEGNDNW